ncbi:MAG TPA: GGDEF domain-containing protein [Gallionella sp.]|nr:GGDEF domain-containing protein [Gallionella sp.]
MNEAIPMRRFFILLGLIYLIEMLLMLTVEPVLISANYPFWIRAIVDSALLAIICVPFMLNYQLRPMQMAYHDSLTGLPNRLLFHDRLEHALLAAKRNKSSCAVVFLDLDRFKPVNDICGHRVGDVVLKQAASRIEGCMRESDTVARIGGDEFAILLSGPVQKADADQVVQKISEALSLPFEVRGKRLDLGVSAGIAFYPQNGTDGMTLLDAADDAMYRAKEIKKSSICDAMQGSRI